MKIIFLIPGTRISGGIRVVFEYANHLITRGHDVLIIHPLSPLPYASSLYPAHGMPEVTTILEHKVGWFDLKAKLIGVPTLEEKYIPKADIIVATWWETAYCIKNYKIDRGQKFYLIQGYETWGGPKELVEGSYKLGLKNVVISTFLKDALRKIDADVCAVIPNGVNLNDFYVEQRQYVSDTIRILMPYRPEGWKGTEDGTKAFEIANTQCKNIKLVMFGLERGPDVPDYVEFHVNAVGKRLREIYNSCDIFLFSGRTEGSPLAPMEAMACKCAVVTTDVGGISDYVISGKTALVSKPNDTDALAQNLIALIKDRKKLHKIAEAGNKHIKEFTWDRSTEQLENTFKSAFNG